MMKCIFTGIVFAFSATLFAQEQQMHNYVEWIAEHSDFEYHGEQLPTIRTAEQQELKEQLYGDRRVRDLQARGSKVPQVLAIYNNDKNEIIYWQQLDLSQYQYHHILVHELVHFLQMTNSVEYNCPAELEIVAYDIQLKWQRTVDHNSPRPKQSSLDFITGCSRRH